MEHETGNGGGVTRREVLRRGGGIVVFVAGGSLLAACGGSDASSPATTAAAGAATSAPASSAAASAPTASGTLNFLGYEGDDFKDIYKQWLASNGVDFKASYISDDSELFSKLKSGSVAADLISCTLPWGPYLEQGGIVSPIDESKIPNLANLWPFFKSAPPGFFTNADGKWITVPAYWGTMGIAWDKTVVPEVTAWGDILDPAFTGKVALIDFPTIHLVVAAQVKGFDTSKMTQDDLQAFKDFMVPIVKQAKTVTGSFGDLISLLGSKEVAAVFPGYTFISGGATAAGNTDVSLNLSLAEGNPLVAEMYAIPPGAKNVDTAYAFLNESLSPEVAAQVAAAQGAITTVTDAVAALDADTKALYPYDDLDTFLSNAKVMANPPQQSEQYVTGQQLTDAWTEIKQQAGK